MRIGAAWGIALALVSCSGKKDSGGSATPPPTASGAPAASGSAVASGAATTPGSGSAADAPVAATSDAPAAAAAERPLYYDRELTDADLDGRSLRELSLMRNWIFARVGNPFRKAWLREYFGKQAWYHAADKADESQLTAIDRANAKRIAAREAGFTPEQLATIKDAIAAKASPSAEEQIELSLVSTRLGTWAGEAPAAGDAKHTPLEDPARLDALLALDDLANLSRRDLRMLRNTVYARRGRPFKSELLQQWFGDMAWYHADPDYSDTRLSAIDQKNIHLIRSVEDQLGGPLSDHDQKDEEGWFSGS
ncbi:MAG: YARHG domain-containing protein [Deltaproteobacteria bacterium]|nr:YARHG domain-containing protein [Deltaproteobacteria bacterium]